MNKNVEDWQDKRWVCTLIWSQVESGTYAQAEAILDYYVETLHNGVRFRVPNVKAEGTVVGEDLGLGSGVTQHNG